MEKCLHSHIIRDTKEFSGGRKRKIIIQFLVDLLYETVCWFFG